MCNTMAMLTVSFSEITSSYFHRTLLKGGTASSLDAGNRNYATKPLNVITVSCQNQPLMPQPKMSFISMAFCQVSFVQLKALTGLNKTNKHSSKNKTLHKKDYKKEQK